MPFDPDDYSEGVIDCLEDAGDRNLCRSCLNRPHCRGARTFVEDCENYRAEAAKPKPGKRRAKQVRKHIAKPSTQPCKACRGYGRGWGKNGSCTVCNGLGRHQLVHVEPKDVLAAQATSPNMVATLRQLFYQAVQRFIHDNPGVQAYHPCSVCKHGVLHGGKCRTFVTTQDLEDLPAAKYRHPKKTGCTHVCPGGIPCTRAKHDKGVHEYAAGGKSIVRWREVE